MRKKNIHQPSSKGIKEIHNDDDGFCVNINGSNIDKRAKKLYEQQQKKNVINFFSTTYIDYVSYIFFFGLTIFFFTFFLKGCDIRDDSLSDYNCFII